MGGAGDADARADAEPVVFPDSSVGPAGRNELAEPEGSRGAKVDSIEAAVDLKGRSEAAGAACQIEEARGAAVESHLVEAFERLESAQENAASDVGEFRGDIEHEMIAIGEVDVSVAAT